MAVDSLTCYAKSAHYFPDRCSTSGLLVATESIYGLTGGKCPDRSENKATNYYIDGKQKAVDTLARGPFWNHRRGRARTVNPGDLASPPVLMMVPAPWWCLCGAAVAAFPWRH